MSEPTANRNLELACTVGSMENALEAIEDGADVNANGGAPLFLAILNRDRALIHCLLDRGADASFYLSKKRQAVIANREELVEELIACSPHNPRDVKPEAIVQIDDAIRREGVHYLLAELEWDVATRFRDSLDAIGAGSTHRCVAEFLQWARSENGAVRDTLPQFLDRNGPTVSEYRERYLSTGEDLVALANDFVSEGSDGESAGE